MYYISINYGFMFITLAITLLAQYFVSSSYKKYSKISNGKNISGAEVARKILDNNGLKDVYVIETRGELTDHYDPTRKVIKLSTKVFHGNTIASAAVAAHECGHAIQDKDEYTFMRIRSAIVPLVNFSSYAGYLAILIGLLFSNPKVFWIGIILLCIILLFQLVTLPVEFDASKRALEQLHKYKLVSKDDIESSKNMLTAAAFTYVASLVTTILQILRLILIFTDRRD